MGEKPKKAMEKEDVPDFSNLLMLAECACGDGPPPSPPTYKKPRDLSVLVPPPSFSSLPHNPSAPTLPRLNEAGPQFSSLLQKKLHCEDGPPPSSLPFKKRPFVLSPPHSSLPHKKLLQPNPPLQGWLEAHLRLKGTTPLCFGEKLVTFTDIADHFKRFLVPKEMAYRIMSSEILTDEEKMLATSSSGVGLPVSVLDRMGRAWRLVFKYWKSSKAQVLVGEWRRLVKENGLKANFDRVSLWAFRAGGLEGPLWFVLG